MAEFARFAVALAAFPIIAAIDWIDHRKYRLWEARYLQSKIDAAEGE